MKKILIIALFFAFTACKSQKLPPEKTVEKEVVRTEYIETLRIDTLRITIPEEGKERTTLDTISELETSLAISTAKLIGGFLFHSIKNKNAEIRAPVVVKDTYTAIDSIQFKYIAEPYPVPAEFTKWQSFLMMLGLIVFWVIIAIIIIAIGYCFLRKRLKIFSKNIR